MTTDILVREPVALEEIVDDDDIPVHLTSDEDGLSNIALCGVLLESWDLPHSEVP